MPNVLHKEEYDNEEPDHAVEADVQGFSQVDLVEYHENEDLCIEGASVGFETFLGFQDTGGEVSMPQKLEERVVDKPD